MQKPYDVIVVGLGAHGSAALYQLAKRNQKILGIDQFNPPHVYGSTHGDTRITRQANGEGEEYVPFALRSYEIWRELENETREELLTITGGLTIADTIRPAKMHGHADFFQRAVDAAEKFAIPHEILNSDQIHQRFPEFNVRDTEMGYYEPGAGFLRPERCVATNLRLARKYEAEIVTHARVHSFEQCGALVKVKFSDCYLLTKQLVVTAGPWVARFLGKEYHSLFSVRRQVMFWFDVQHNFENFVVGKLPIFIWELVDEKEGMYGFPAIDGPGGGLKIASEQYETQTSPDKLNRQVTSEEIDEMYENFASKYFPNLSRKCVKTAVCMYTITPGFRFLIDRHPDCSQVIVASPCSGHGFKHSAAIGEALAELVVDGKSRIDLSPFSFNRF